VPAPFFLALVLGFLPSVNRSRGRVKAVLQTRASAFEALGAPPAWAQLGWKQTTTAWRP